MNVYRIYVPGEPAPVAVVIAANKTSANAFAQGRYGPGSIAYRVDWKPVLEANHVCEVLNTVEKTSSSLGRTYRVPMP